jgi:hypothetical protein
VSMAALVRRLDKLRDLLRRYFTIEYVLEKASSARAKDTTRTIKSSRRCHRIPPSERFIWAMVVLIVALVGLVAIEIVLILVTGVVDEAILVVICGIIGALVSRFLEARV